MKEAQFSVNLSFETQNKDQDNFTPEIDQLNKKRAYTRRSMPKLRSASQPSSQKRGAVSPTATLLIPDHMTQHFPSRRTSHRASGSAAREVSPQTPQKWPRKVCRPFIMLLERRTTQYNQHTHQFESIRCAIERKAPTNPTTRSQPRAQPRFPRFYGIQSSDLDINDSDSTIAPSSSNSPARQPSDLHFQSLTYLDSATTYHKP